MAYLSNSSQAPKLKKGILLAGGNGTRLHPLTRAVNKHLLQVYDKPLIYYPLTTLMLAGVTEIIIISTPRDLPALRKVIGDGHQWGLSISYASQETPNGIAEGILIAGDFIADEPFAMVLGDNLFYGRSFASLLVDAAKLALGGAVIFTYSVLDGTSYGILEVDDKGRPLALSEKPGKPASNRAVTGLYFYDHQAVAFARSLRPSNRNELEITDLNRIYLEQGQLEPMHLGRGIVWFDAGTVKNLLLASQLVEIVQERTRTGIGFPEEVAYRRQLIDFSSFCVLVDDMPNCGYRDYLQALRREIEESPHGYPIF